MRRWHSLAPAVFLASLLGSLSCAPPAPKSVNSTKNSPSAEDAKRSSPDSKTENGVQANTKKTTANAGAASASSAQEFGEPYPDPTWFNAGIFADAKVVQQSRSQRDADGMYTSQFLFELPEGVTEAQCVQRLQEVNKDAVATLKVLEEEGRTKLTGDAASYTVTHVCGATPEGAIRALVSYRWTRAPTG